MNKSTSKRNKITALLFIVVIVALFSGNFINYKVVGKTMLSSYRERSAIKSGGTENVKKLIGSVNDAVNKGTLARENFVELYGLTQKILNRKIMSDPEYGALYKIRGGEIVFAVNDKYMDGYLQNMYELANGLKKNEIPLLYVQLPFKLPYKSIEDPLPKTAYDRSNENADYFVDALNKSNIDTYDIRKEFWNFKNNGEKKFFKTDHHWTIDAAFHATGMIEKKMNDEYGFSIDSKYSDIRNYNRKVFKDYFVGSMGRRVGKIYGGKDDFTLITPKFDTDITLTEVENGIENVKRGKFDDAVLVKKYIKNPDVTTNRYAVYHGDNRELIFKNKNEKKGKVLIIKDSFGIPVYSFMSLGVNEVRALDLRLFKDDVLEYARKYKPDLVMITYNADCFSDEMFNFNIKGGMGNEKK